MSGKLGHAGAFSGNKWDGSESRPYLGYESAVIDRRYSLHFHGYHH
jgi:hypothetical protein